jgi:GNAT superfamily N-acetyltransferase
MNGLVEVFVRAPNECTSIQLADFKALVLAGREIIQEGLEERIHSAVRLVFLSIGCCLRGVAALKRPLASYRRVVIAKSGIPLSQEEYPFELGWVFLMPSARGRKFSLDLTSAALAAANSRGVFATSRTDNHGMHSTLARYGFLSAGKPYPSDRGKHHLQLFLRQRIETGTAEASPAEPSGTVPSG